MLQDKIDAIKYDIEKLKEEFETVITDKSHSLDERWEVWTNAPDYLKNHKGSIIDLEAFEEIEIDWDDDFYLEKYEEVDMAEIVCRIYDMTDKYPEEWIHSLEEEILSKNLGSFTYDW